MSDTLRYRETQSAPLQLDVAGILRKRAPGIPGFVARLLARIVRQDELNRLLRVAFPGAGSDFSRRILRELDIDVQVSGIENIPDNGRLVFASNHPLGGLDGITLIALLGERYGDENIIFPVNDMLMHVRPLQGVFTPINKYGRQGRESASGLQRAFEGGGHVIIFPAGLVSRLGPEGIRDLEWKKTFLAMAATTGRTIVPVRFEARNRMRFYRLARWRKRLRIPVNLEQAFLPAELCAARGRTFRITFLPPVDAAAHLDACPTPRAAARAIRDMVYAR